MGIHEKLMRIQTEIKAPKNLYNSFGKYKYRNAEGICEAVKPYLAKEKCTLTLSDEITATNDRIYVEATATFTDTETGESVIATAYAREPLDKKGMDDSQITGTASSYARKYALNGLFLLDDTKDADTDEYHNQTQPEMASAEQLHKINEMVATYAEMCENATAPDVMKVLKENFKFNSTGEITSEIAEKVIQQLDIWCKKKKGA